MNDLQIRTATWDDEPRIAALMALAFANDPYVRWLLPDPLDYLRSSEKHVRLSAAPAFENGTAYVIGDFAGASVCLPPGTNINRTHENDADTPETNVPAEFDELISKSAAYCPDTLHWLLAFIVVDPAQQGKGLGTAILKHTLDQCDRDKLPTFLESTNIANTTLYKRFGFKLLAKVTVGQSPARYPMLRQPL